MVIAILCLTACNFFALLVLLGKMKRQNKAMSLLAMKAAIDDGYYKDGGPRHIPRDLWNDAIGELDDER